VDAASYDLTKIWVLPTADTRDRNYQDEAKVGILHDEHAAAVFPVVVSRGRGLDVYSIGTRIRRCGVRRVIVHGILRLYVRATPHVADPCR
jgi:hypothetical protein